MRPRPLPPLGPTLTRRGFLEGALGVAGAAALGPLPGCAAGYPFTLGVASGEPHARSVVLWTRLAPDPLGGGGVGSVNVPVAWELASDPGMQDIVRSGVVETGPAWGHAVHVIPRFLDADRWYWYRFHALGATSPVGRTRTMPAFESAAQRLRFALCSCQDYQNGFYSAYHNMAQEDLDLVVHVGDYIYEGGVDGSAPRQHNSGQIFTLDDYRNRYALYKLDPSLQAAHQNFPFIVTWDDHELDNNYAGDSPSDGSSPEAFAARKAAAYQAYYEHMPLRPWQQPRGTRLQLFRELRFGDLARFFVLDTRQYRTDQPCGELGPPCGDELTGTMTGDRQERWLLDGLARSGSIWNVLAQQVMMTRINFDAWDGYQAVRGRLLEFLATQRPSNPVVLTGDIHSAWVAELKRDFSDPGSETVASEFVTTSISSEFPAQLAPIVPNVLPGNPQIRYFEGLHRGYLRCDVTRDRWIADFRGVDSILDPQASVQTLASFVVEDGVPGLEPA